MGRMRPSRDIQPITEFRAHEALIDQIELLKDIRIAEAEIDAGKGIPHAKIVKQLRARLMRSRALDP